MPNSTKRSRTKSIRFPNELWSDIEYHCESKGVTFNEWCIGVLRRATPERPPEVAEGQRMLPL